MSLCVKVILISLIIIILCILFKRESFNNDTLNTLFNTDSNLQNRLQYIEDNIAEILKKKEENTKDENIGIIPKIVNSITVSGSGTFSPESSPINSRMQLFLLPVENNSVSNFLCEIEPADRELVSDVIITGTKNGKPIKEFGDEYSILYSFYESDYTQNDVTRTYENMILLEKWSNLSKPYLFHRERVSSELNSRKWSRGWLQIKVYKVSKEL